MIRYRPGFAPIATDGDSAPSAPRKPGENPLPSVADAMALATQRQTQVLNYTRKPAQPSPLVQTVREDGPTLEVWVKAGYLPENYPPPGYAELPSPALTAYKATLAGLPQSLGSGIDALVTLTPHSVNSKPQA